MLIKFEQKKHSHSMTKTESKKRGLLLILHNQYNNKIVDKNFSKVFMP